MAQSIENRIKGLKIALKVATGKQKTSISKRIKGLEIAKSVTKAPIPKPKKKVRPSPSRSATSVPVGTIEDGNDGNTYIVDVDKNGRQYWKKHVVKVTDEITDKDRSAEDVKRKIKDKEIVEANPVLQEKGFITKMAKWNQLKAEADQKGLSREASAKYISEGMDKPLTTPNVDSKPKANQGKAVEEINMHKPEWYKLTYDEKVEKELARMSKVGISIGDTVGKQEDGKLLTGKVKKSKRKMAHNLLSPIVVEFDNITAKATNSKRDYIGGYKYMVGKDFLKQITQKKPSFEEGGELNEGYYDNLKSIDDIKNIVGENVWRKFSLDDDEAYNERYKKFFQEHNGVVAIHIMEDEVEITADSDQEHGDDMSALEVYLKEEIEAELFDKDNFEEGGRIEKKQFYDQLRNIEQSADSYKRGIGKNQSLKDENWELLSALQNANDIKSYIENNSSFDVQEVEVIEKGRTYPHNPNDNYIHDIYKVKLAGGQYFIIDKSEGSPAWQGNVDFTIRISAESGGGMKFEKGGELPEEGTYVYLTKDDSEVGVYNEETQELIRGGFETFNEADDWANRNNLEISWRQDEEDSYAKGGLTPEKAQQMLDDGVANKKPLTEKQKRYFHWIVSNKKSKYASGGGIQLADQDIWWEFGYNDRRGRTHYDWVKTKGLDRSKAKRLALEKHGYIVPLSLRRDLDKESDERYNDMLATRKRDSKYASGGKTSGLTTHKDKIGEWRKDKNGRSWNLLEQVKRDFYDKKDGWYLISSDRGQKLIQPVDWERYYEIDQDEFSFGKGGYMVFNYTDDIYASPHTFKTKKEANDFIKSFRKRFETQGYYRDNRHRQIKPQDIDLLAVSEGFNPYRGSYAKGGMIFTPQEIEDLNGTLALDSISTILRKFEKEIKNYGISVETEPLSDGEIKEITTNSQIETPPKEALKHIQGFLNDLGVKTYLKFKGRGIARRPYLYLDSNELVEFDSNYAKGGDLQEYSAIKYLRENYPKVCDLSEDDLFDMQDKLQSEFNLDLETAEEYALDHYNLKMEMFDIDGEIYAKGGETDYGETTDKEMAEMLYEGLEQDKLFQILDKDRSGEELSENIYIFGRLRYLPNKSNKDLTRLFNNIYKD